MNRLTYILTKKPRLFRGFFLFLFFIHFKGYTQFIDSIPIIISQNKPRFEFKLNSRNSFISNTSSKVFGVKFGLNHNERISYGIGYNLTYNPQKDKIGINDNGMLKKVTANLIANYFSIYGSYRIYKKGPFSYAIPVLVGFGNVRYSYKLLNERISTNKKVWVSYEPMMIFGYDLVNYISLGAGFGYRIVSPISFYNQKLSAPIYSVNLSVKFFQWLADKKE